VVHLYYDFALQDRRLSVVQKGVLCLELIMVHLYYDVDLQGRRLRVV
jgi:hypothetical protein